MNHVASMTRTPAIAPISAAIAGVTKAHGAVIATSPASMPLAIIPGSGLPVRRVTHSIAIGRPERPGDRCVRRNGGELNVGGGERRGGVEAEPAEQEDERAEQRHRDVVSGERAWLAVAAVLADAWAEHEGAGEGSRAADGVDDARAGEVDVAGAEVHRVPRLRQPAATPRPRREQRVVEGAAEEAPDHEAAPLPPLGHRPGGDRRHGVHEGDHVDEQGEHAGVDAAARQRPAALEQEDPVAVTDQRRPDGATESAEVAGHVERAQRQREADQEEPDEGEAEDGEVRADDVSRVLGTTEPRLDEGEAGLHEDHQDRPDDDPQHVDLPAEGGHRIDLGLPWGKAEQETVHELPPHD